MGVTRLVVIAVVLGQRFLLAPAIIDVPLALAIVGPGIVILAACSSVQRLTPTTAWTPMM
jgi:hypothetical protein